MSFKVRSTQYYEDAEHGSFELPFTGEFYRETLQVSEDGLRAVLGVLCADDDPRDPFEGDSEGLFVQFDGSYIHYEPRPEIDDFKRIIRENPGRVVTVDRFDHGNSLYVTVDHFDHGNSLYKVAAGPFTVADTKGIRTKHGHRTTSKAEHALDHANGYYIVPADATDPAAYAKGMLENYTDFCSGNVYGVCVWVYTRPDVDSDWELDEDGRDECWGYNGADYAEQKLTDRMEHATK